MVKNIILAGVGGLGLVLTTKIITESAFLAGYDVKSNDVIGLSQRGGKVWGSIRFGEKVYSPDIPRGQGDILLALEPLEGYRWSSILKEKGLIILNSKEIYPTPVLMERENYPQNIYEIFSNSYTLIKVNAVEEGKKIGNSKIANTILIGIMAKYLDIPYDIWLKTIENNVPAKSLDLNLIAFDKGYNL